MPRFRYTATNEKGKTVRGLLEAPSEEAIDEFLEESDDEAGVSSRRNA